MQWHTSFRRSHVFPLKNASQSCLSGGLLGRICCRGFRDRNQPIGVLIEECEAGSTSDEFGEADIAIAISVHPGKPAGAGAIRFDLWLGGTAHGSDIVDGCGP